LDLVGGVPCVPP